MERQKGKEGDLEKVSDQKSTDLAIAKEEKGLISRFRSALAGLFARDEKPAIKLSEEEESKIQASVEKCSDILRDLHHKADAQFTGPVFERIFQADRMEEEYLFYDDAKEYMIYNCQTDLELWEAFEAYLKSIDGNSEVEKIFANSRDFASVINVFGSHPRICREVFMLIFKGDLKKARAMLDCAQMREMNSNLGLSIVTKLLQQDPQTIGTFLILIKQMPKKYINSDSRVDLLIEFAASHRDRVEPSSSKEAVEYIARKETDTHPYR